MGHSWAWRRWPLKINQLFCPPFLSRIISHGTLSSRSQKSPKPLNKFTVVILHFALFFPLWILTPLDRGHCSQGCSQPIHSEHFSLFLSILFSRTFPLFIFITCVRKVSSVHIRNLLCYCCLVVLSFHHILGRYKSSMRTGTCNCETSSSCIKKVSFTSSQSGSL